MCIDSVPIAFPFISFPFVVNDAIAKMPMTLHLSSLASHTTRITEGDKHHYLSSSHDFALFYA
jgi:hypothetical protein